MSKSNTIKNLYTGKDYLKAKGKIKYGMMNDYIFRIVFQENKRQKRKNAKRHRQSPLY